MGRWLDYQKNTVYVTAEDGKQYAFQARKSDNNAGFIVVRCGDGKQRSVAGDRDGDRFVTNPLGKNARAILSQEAIDIALGLAKLHPDPLANEYGPPNQEEVNG